MESIIIDGVKLYGAPGLAVALLWLMYRELGKRLSEITDRFIAYMTMHAEKDREADEKIVHQLEVMDQRSSAQHQMLMEHMDRVDDHMRSRPL